MNKVISIFILLVSSLVSFNASSAFTLNGTRFIYDEGRKNISIEIANSSEKTYGGQVWVDNLNDLDNVFFVPAPNLFKVSGGEKQIIRLLYVNDILPKDKESLFWLNVQEIPPVASADESNVLAVALNTQVKLIYRPKALAAAREDAEKNLKLRGSVLKNPTPYYFAITQIALNGNPVKLDKKTEQDISLLAPFSEVTLPRALSGKVSIEAIDDYGARRTFDIQ
ncbi:fimbrial chaperone [Pragia fontium]|uniref:P pilus assembly protein, chaperone PapD n=2 Tax=Pragia fontium TaxID=82985 RepID=A0AAJ4WCJ0_9GAMM|nr:fimbrial chaperone [Pragia fontium]GKX64277.1 molecular chaperone FimC [Pragia fontium]SFD21726.1 P pilus assembly protein, chaperone PapD [Pragia fontium DSM 5563 = ATCC 49100]VEJ56967.1 Chaperone protein faeE precursor [Pragia fontium]